MKNKNKNPYILGLDVGSNSIGWAVVDCIKEEGDHKGIYAGYKPTSLRALNSRIFLEMVEAKTRVPKNQKRREKRGARKRRSFYKRRREKLVRILIDKRLLPEDYRQCPEKTLNQIDRRYGERKVGKHWSKTWSVTEKAHCSPYAMRNFALEENLEPFEFGRLLLHLQRRRGYFSNRGAKYIELIKHLSLDSPEDGQESMSVEEKKETGKVLQAIEKLHEELEGSTLGQFIWQKSQKHQKPPHRITLFEFEKSRTHKSETRIERLQFRAKREMYEKEFDAIWEKQSNFHDLSGQKHEIKHATFYQRPLQLQKNAVGNCNIYPHKKRSALMRLEFQEFRTLQMINNLKVDGNPLSGEQRNKLWDAANDPDKLNESGRIPWKEVARILEIKRATLNYETNEDGAGKTGLIGNKTAKAISASIGANKWRELGKDKQIKLVEDLQTIHNKKDLYYRLVTHWKFAPYQPGDNKKEKGALGLTMDEELEDGYGKHSLKAINELLPHLRDGLDYYKAVEKIGHRESITPNQRKTEDDYVLSVADVPNIANPVVQKALYEMRRVVNSIVKRYGKPVIIRMEMAREMKSSKKHRAEIASQQKKNREDNEKAESEILDYWQNGKNPHIELEQLRNNRARVSRNDRSKYKMWKYEQDEKCPYCQRPIGPNQLFSGDAEIEHILPYTGFRQNYLNTLVSCRACNQRKGQQTPYEAWGSDPDQWERIEEFAKGKYVRELYGKQRRILEKKHSPETVDDFVERQLNDTRYIATASKTMLQKYGVPVDVNTGMATNELRHQFGLNNILPHEPDTDAYIPTGDKVDTATGEILQFSADKAKKSRQDHRHHAIDAFVVAMTDRAMLKAMVDAHQIEQDNKNPSRQKTREDRIRERRLVLPESWEESEELHSVLKGKLVTTVASHMVKRKVWGALHEETLYGKSSYDQSLDIEGMTTAILKRVQRVAEADTSNTDWIADEELRSMLADWSKEMLEKKPSDRVLPYWKGKELKKFDYQCPTVTVRRKLMDELGLLSGLKEEWKPGAKTWVADKSIHDALFKWLEEHGLTGKKGKEIKEVLTKVPPRVLNKKGEPSTPILNVRIARAMTDSYIKIANSYVQPGSNHHLVIYHNGLEGKNRERRVEMVTMLEAAKRAKSNKPVIDRNPPLEWDGEWHYELDLCVNDMVRCEDLDIFENDNFAPEHRASPWFRVQTMNSGGRNKVDLRLRHHSVSGTDSNWGLWRIRSLKNVRCRKEQIGNLGLLVDDS